MKKPYLFILGIVICGFFASCEYTPIIPEEGKTGDISFATDIQPIFTSKCIACHKTGGSAPFSLEAGKSYETITTYSPGLIDKTTPANSLLYTEPGSANHSFGALTQAEKDNILNWIEQGAKNN